MHMTSLAVKVRYLDGQSFDYDASRVMVKDAESVLTISFGHARLFSALTAATVTIIASPSVPNSIEPVLVSDGLMKVDRNVVMITVFH